MGSSPVAVTLFVSLIMNIVNQEYWDDAMKNLNSASVIHNQFAKFILENFNLNHYGGRNTLNALSISESL